MKEQGTARNMSRRSFMALTAIAGVQTAVFGLSGCAPKGSSTESGTGFKPGTYTGTGEGKFGTVVVETTFSEEGITNIALTDHEETERVSDRAIEEVPAAIIEYQSLDVDTVTGATLTSAAIIAGVTDCVK